MLKHDESVMYNCIVPYCSCSFKEAGNLKQHYVGVHLELNFREQIPEDTLYAKHEKILQWICQYNKIPFE